MNIKISISPALHITSSVQYHWKCDFLDAMRQMDIVKIADLIDDDIVINDQTKWEFLTELRDQFSDLKSKGNETLQPKMSICLECNRGCDVIFFAGKEPGQGSGIYFKYNKNKLIDVIICNGSTGTFKTSKLKDYYY